MPDGTTRRLTSSEISDKLAQEATPATYSDRQIAAMSSSEGAVGAIGRFGVDMKFDSEGVLVAGDAPDTPPAARARARATVVGATGRSTVQDRIARLNEAAIGENNLNRKARLEEQIAKLTGQQTGGSPVRNTARARQRARVTPRGERGRQVSGEAQQKARYERILRTQGPAAAQRFSSFSGYEPPRSTGVVRQPQAQSGSNMDQLIQELLRRLLGQGGGGNRGGVVPRAINRAAGGSAGMGDVIPAMLTPGEFIMSAGAVRQHGVGAMRALNRGKVPGFNRGGMVGGVQYRQEGGSIGMMGGAGQSLGIDTSEITKTFDNFVGNFSSTLDSITTAFSPIASAISGLAETFSNINITSTLTVDGQLNISGVDSNAIAEELKQAFGKMIGDEVQRVLENNNKEARP